MASLGDLLARVRVASVTGVLPPDLAQAILEELGRRAQPAERHAVRNLLLSQAAALVSGSLWAKARRLEREIAGLTSGRRAQTEDVDGVRALVAQALELDPDMPHGWRQMLRILDP